MATLNIGGRRVTVDDSFLSLSPEQQQATVEEIEASFGAAPAEPAPAVQPAQATQAPVQSAPDAPWYSKLGQAADDIVRLGANAMTLGLADRIASAAGGTTLQEEQARSQQAADRAGSAGIAAQIGGTMLPAGVLAKGVGAAVPALAKAGGALGLAGRTGSMAAQGAALGATEAAIGEKDIGDGALYGGIAGALGNVAGEGISAGVRRVAGAFNKAPAVPTRESLEALKNQAYAAADNAGVIYSPAAVDRLNQRVASELSKIGFDPALQPGATVALKRIQDLTGQNVTLTGLDTVRKIASNGFVPGNKSNNSAISKIIDAIDDVMENPAAADVLTGNGAAAGRVLTDARDYASRLAKLNKVEDAVSRADLRAASTGSGGNADNATRQNLRRILENPRGFKADERAALDTAVRGTAGQNALRLAGKLSPSGNGLMAALGVGGAMVNPMIGVASLGGMGAKALADRSTAANVQELARVIAAGGSRAATQAPPNMVQRLAEAKREALARALMSSGLVAAQ